MPEAPESYLDTKRPPLLEALELEGDVTIERATELLSLKGYFTPPPRPWQLGSQDQGMGRQNFVVLDKFGDVVVEVGNRQTAEFIISAANDHS